VWLVKTSVFTDVGAPWRLCAAILTGIVVYSVMTLLINRSAVRQCLTLMRMQG
jgi:hypothetical protein